MFSTVNDHATTLVDPVEGARCELTLEDLDAAAGAGEITITKKTVAASPSFFRNCCAGANYKEASLSLS